MPSYSYSAKIMLYRGGKYLTIRRSASSGHFAGVWDFPGGKIDAGEVAEQTVFREAREETGLTVSGIEFIGTTQVVLPDRIISYKMYRGKAGSGNVRLSSEHDAYKWATKKELLEFNMTPQLRDFIRRLSIGELGFRNRVTTNRARR